jgi:hypothetical protein
MWSAGVRFMDIQKFTPESRKDRERYNREMEHAVAQKREKDRESAVPSKKRTLKQTT